MTEGKGGDTSLCISRERLASVRYQTLVDSERDSRHSLVCVMGEPCVRGRVGTKVPPCGGSLGLTLTLGVSTPNEDSLCVV